MDRKTFYESYGGSAPENYERYFVPFIGRPLATELMEAAALRPGERVLDAACGTGIITRLAAEGVGSEGTVEGLDMNPGMLAVARSVAPPDRTIEWHESSAESMPLADGTYDVVLCQLGLQFMADKQAALHEMHRVLAPGGRLAVSVAGPTPPPFVVLADALGRHISPEIGPFVHMVFSLHDPDQLKSLFTEAGFSDVSVQTFKRKLRLPPPKDFLWQYIHSTPLVQGVMKADDGARAALEADVVEEWQGFVEEGALIVEPQMLVATGRKA